MTEDSIEHPACFVQEVVLAVEMNKCGLHASISLESVLEGMGMELHPFHPLHLCASFECRGQGEGEGP